MSNNWQQTAIIAAGGTVIDIATDTAGGVWLATNAGIFGKIDEAWTPLAQGQPLSQITALDWADTALFAGGRQGQIAYSTDSGQSWYQGRIGQTNVPVTSFAAAPNLRQKGTILAGTDGAGILRSTDRGRNWQLANFGLQDFSVIALATTPTWERREIAFAATAYGFYRSSNGGRAWKKSDTGLDGAIVQNIAVSPNFAKDRTVLVGTESQGIFRSTDNGKSWHPWGQGLTPDPVNELPPVNSLWLHPEFATTPICAAGTGNGQLFYSADGGANWQRVAEVEAAVLCVGGTEQELYAGLHDQGLLRSIDNGQTWVQVSNLAARAITRLAGDEDLLAFGPLEGVWRSTDGGKNWTQLTELTKHLPLLTVAASPKAKNASSAGAYPPCLLVATQFGLLYSADKGESWQSVLPNEEVVTICFSHNFAHDGQVWTGTGGGKLLASTNGGQSWATGNAPKPGIPLVALAHLPLAQKAGGDTLTAVTYKLDRGQMTVWRSTDSGSTWQQWQQVSANWPVAYVNIAGQAADRVLICLDRRGWCSTPTGWERVLETEQSVLRLDRLADNGGLLALTAKQLLHSPDGINWSAADEGLAGQTLLDLATSSTTDGDQVVSTLTPGGVLWQRRF